VSDPLPVVEELSFSISGQFGGVAEALTVDGTTAYVGFGPRLFILDVSDSSNPRLLGRSEPLSDLIRDIDVVDRMVYVAAGEGGLIVLDAGDLANPVVVSEGPNYVRAAEPSAEEVTVVDNTAYVVDVDFHDLSVELLRFDVMDPAHVSLMDSTPMGTYVSVTVTNEFMVAAGDGHFQLRSLDNPATILGETRLAGDSYTRQIIVQDNIVTVAKIGNGGGGITEQFDISNPAEPVSIGEQIPLGMAYLNQAVTNGRSLFLAEIYGDMGFCASEIFVYDMSGHTDQEPTVFYPDSCLFDLEIEGDTLYAVGFGGLQIHDASDPANLVLSSQFTHPDGFHDARSVAVREQVIYIHTTEGRTSDIVALDVSDPTAARPGSRITLDLNSSLDLYVTGNTLIAAVQGNGLTTLDISDPLSPQLLQQPAEGSSLLRSGIAAVGDHVVYTIALDETSAGRTGVIDLSDPADPTVAAILGTGEWPRSMVLDGDMLYVLNEERIHFFDVSRPLQPQPAGSLSMPETTTYLAIVGQTLYAACDPSDCQGMYAIDVSNPQNPIRTHYWALPFSVASIVADGSDILYLATYGEGTYALSAADPDSLRVSGHLQLPKSISEMKIVGDAIYATNSRGGIYLIQIE
jgi:hypothetical protein